MNTPREVIYQTIFNQLKEAVVTPLNFKTASRRLVAWDKVDPSQQPALYQTQKSEVATVGGRGMPTKWDLDIDVTLYVNAGNDENLIPSSYLNPAVDIIEGLFPGAATSTYQTLGIPGVQEIRIQGEVIYYEGLLGAQAVCLIPIHIIAT